MVDESTKLDWMCSCGWRVCKNLCWRNLHPLDFKIGWPRQLRSDFKYISFTSKLLVEFCKLSGIHHPLHRHRITTVYNVRKVHIVCQCLVFRKSVRLDNLGLPNYPDSYWLHVQVGPTSPAFLVYHLELHLPVLASLPLTTAQTHDSTLTNSADNVKLTRVILYGRISNFFCSCWKAEKQWLKHFIEVNEYWFIM